MAEDNFASDSTESAISPAPPRRIRIPVDGGQHRV
jgi:hypothetical protein